MLQGAKHDYSNTQRGALLRSLTPIKFDIILVVLMVQLTTPLYHRIPERLIDSLCRCNGCISLITAVEDSANSSSIPLRITVPVLIYGQQTTVEVHIGCTCITPIVV